MSLRQGRARALSWQGLYAKDPRPAVPGIRSFRGGFIVHRDQDPRLALGEVIWFEAREPSLTRPMARLRVTVTARHEDGGNIRYEVAQAPTVERQTIMEEWRQG